MKYLAHIENDLESEIISIYDVIKGKNSKNPDIWENRTYYSLWYKTPMLARVKGKRKPHFAFKKGYGGNKNSGGGEGIEHELSKKIIYDLKTLKLKIGKTEGEIQFSETIIEKPFNNGRYISDLYCKIFNENEFNFPVNSMLAIELHYTNKISDKKQMFYRDHNIACIEIDIWKKIRFEGNIEKLQNQLTGYFKKQRFAKRIHDPNWRNLIPKKETEPKQHVESKFEQKAGITTESNYHCPKDHNLTSQNKIIETKKPKQLPDTEKLTESIWRKILDFISVKIKCIVTKIT